MIQKLTGAVRVRKLLLVETRRTILKQKVEPMWNLEPYVIKT